MNLSTEEKYFARKFFKLEVLQRQGQDFENFFVKIMQFHHKEFVPVKPQGQFGDRKNDGFIKSEGKYYQVYSPEDPESKEYDTIKKLNTDFAGLYKHWNDQVTPIKEFHYVLNDKYKGGYPTLHPELTKIEEANEGVKCYPLFASQLEDIFLGLKKDQIQELVGGLLVPEDISAFDSTIMNEVINFILNIESPYDTERIPERPDFNEKIVFNGLGERVSDLLKYGSFQEGSLKEFFKLNSNFAKEDMRNKFNQLYLSGIREIDEGDEKSDMVFFYILKNATMNQSKQVQDAVIVLMSYYFGYCDIFEEPPQVKKKGK